MNIIICKFIRFMLNFAENTYDNYGGFKKNIHRFKYLMRSNIETRKVYLKVSGPFVETLCVF